MKPESESAMPDVKPPVVDQIDGPLMETGEDDIEILQIRLKHTSNELALTKVEYETSLRNYLDLYTRLEEKVFERTEELNRVKDDLEIRNRELGIMLDASPAIIFLKDHENRFIRINSRFSEVLGMTEEDICGRTMDEVARKWIDHPLSSHGGTLTGSGPVTGVECVVENSCSEQRTFVVDRIPLSSAEGRVIGLIGFATDITERNRIEAERQTLRERVVRAEKMEAIGLLAGGVAHDGSNILTGIIGFLELLLIDLYSDDNCSDLVKKTLDCAYQMEQLLNDLLSLTKSGVVPKTVLNLNELIDNYLSSPTHHKILSLNPNVDISLELEPGLLNVLGIKAHLTKCITNLVKNSCDAMNGKGKVRISTQNLYLDAPLIGFDLTIEPGEYVVLEVVDSGTGIEPSDLGRIFEPFFTKKLRGKSGTGLGLALVYNTTKEHGGGIDVASRPGEGTKFRLFFPATRMQKTNDKQEVPFIDLMGSGESILVVDDMPDQLEILMRMLSRLKYSVTVANSGEEALAIFSSSSFDLVILDMIMDPGIDGCETFRRMLAIKPGQRAIIASGFSESDQVRTAMELGAGNFVKKPYSFETIAVTVSEMLRKSKGCKSAGPKKGK